jgi:ketosteroid isomerase-like protein
MNGRYVLSLLTALLFAAQTGSIAHAQLRGVKSDQQTLIELEHKWNEAFYAKDLDFLRSVLADEFLAIYEDGSRGDKAKELAQTESFNQQVTSANQDDFRVNVYGDTAIVWFTLNLVGPRQGAATKVTLRYVDVFVWRDGRWQCVSSHSTKVAE